MIRIESLSAGGSNADLLAKSEYNEVNGFGYKNEVGGRPSLGPISTVAILAIPVVVCPISCDAFAGHERFKRARLCGPNKRLPAPTHIMTCLERPYIGWDCERGFEHTTRRVTCINDK